jgi:hypothetical protein
MLVTEGRVFKGMDVSLMGPGCKPKLRGVSISMIGVELTKVVRGVWPRA